MYQDGSDGVPTEKPQTLFAAGEIPRGARRQSEGTENSPPRSTDERPGGPRRGRASYLGARVGPASDTAWAITPPEGGYLPGGLLADRAPVAAHPRKNAPPKTGPRPAQPCGLERVAAGATGGEFHGGTFAVPSVYL